MLMGAVIKLNYTDVQVLPWVASRVTWNSLPDTGYNLILGWQ